TRGRGDRDRRGARADARIVTGTNATGARRGPFLTLSALLFMASAAGTIHWSRTMAGGMAMPGRWIMSMVWMPMPGQTWAGRGVRFVAMWLVVVVGMVLPPL